ncbi:MAG: hypothetical protein ACK40V_00185 [Anaerolineales bacterium]
MDFLKLIQSLQDLIFEVVVWALLIPKTIIRTIFRPKWMVQYVNQEFEKPEEKQFDEYMPPGLFFLAMAVIPSALLTWMQGMNFNFAESLSQLSESNLITSALTTLISILIYLVWIKWLSKHPVKRSGLKRLFMIQCYLVTPPQLLYVLFIFFGWGTVDSLPLALLGMAMLIFYESFAFEDEMKVNWWKGLWYAAIPYVVFFVLAVLFALILNFT